MADKPLKSITFPGLDDKYMIPEIDSTLTQQDKAADAKKTGDELNDIKNTLSHKADVIYDTASGDIASFPDGADGLPVKDLTVAIEPVQDLHGQANPYPSGGGKNLLPMTVDGIKGLNKHLTWVGNSTTYYEVAITIITDDGGNVTGITTSGTATSGCILNIAQYSLTAGNYVLNGCPSGGSISSYYVDWRSDSGSQLFDAGSGSTYTSAGQSGYMSRIIITAGTNVSGKTFYPMIREASQSATFAPYSNICPISGWTGANVSRTGKNLLDCSNASNATNIVSGVSQDGTISFKDKTSAVWSSSYIGKITIVNGETYTISASSLPYGRLGFSIADNLQPISSKDVPKFQGKSSNFASNIINRTDLDATITATKTETIYLWYCSDSYIQDYHTSFSATIQIELGSTNSAYEQYQGTTLPISWQSQAGTVYGGTLDVTTGVLTVTDANIASYNGETLPGEWISDRDVYSVGATPTTGAQVVYKLATPQTYQLDPVTVETLLGQNNIWSDTGAVLNCEYPADTKLYIDKKLAALVAALS